MLITRAVVQVGLVGQLIKKRLRFDRLLVYCSPIRDFPR